MVCLGVRISRTLHGALRGLAEARPESPYTSTVLGAFGLPERKIFTHCTFNREKKLLPVVLSKRAKEGRNLEAKHLVHLNTARSAQRNSLCFLLVPSRAAI